MNNKHKVYIFLTFLLFESCRTQQTEYELTMPAMQNTIYQVCKDVVVAFPLDNVVEYEFKNLNFFSEEEGAYYKFNFAVTGINERKVKFIMDSMTYSSKEKVIKAFLKNQLLKESCDINNDSDLKYREIQMGKAKMTLVEYCEIVRGFCQVDTCNYIIYYSDHPFEQSDSIFINSIQVLPITKSYK